RQAIRRRGHSPYDKCWSPLRTSSTSAAHMTHERMGNRRKLTEQLQSYLNARNIESFDYTQFNNIEFIGEGGFAFVYSAIFQEKKYALKRLKDLSLDEKGFKQLRREKLEKLSSETTIESITSKIDQQSIEYPDEDDNSNKYDDCCAECENITDNLVPNNIPRLNESSFSVIKSLSQGPNDLISVSIEGLEQLSNQHRIIKPVELINGNLIIECPVHSSLLTNISQENSKEFTHMNYTACTSKPDTFKQENFTLRQAKYESIRMTELFILISLDNEDEILLSSTLHQIVENIAYLCSLNESSDWDKDGWKKIVICIISDRNKINKRTLYYLKALGVYQDDISISKVNNKPVRAHIYEYTTPISIKCSKDSVDKKTIVPAQILFCLQEKNKGKVDSHRWFFNAFCPILNPRICILIKVGVKPGSCGKLYAIKNRRWIYLLNPIVGAQIFEQEISNILNKPMESIFGYISSLPKDFSAYRYSALQDSISNNEDTSNNSNILIANDYLAKNNAICFELISKRNFSWLLHYESSSQAEVDLPENLSEIIQQHLCYLNSYFYTSFYTISHFYYIWRSNHSILRKIILQIEIIYQALYFLFWWFSLGIFCSTFYVLYEMSYFYTKLFGLKEIDFHYNIFIWLYLTFIAISGMQFILAFVNKPQM
ncbi:16188_t:CDS:2, partial [Dentiscutata erythropus]